MRHFTRHVGATAEEQERLTLLMPPCHCLPLVPPSTHLCFRPRVVSAVAVPRLSWPRVRACWFRILTLTNVSNFPLQGKKLNFPAQGNDVIHACQHGAASFPWLSYQLECQQINGIKKDATYRFSHLPLSFYPQGIMDQKEEFSKSISSDLVDISIHECDIEVNAFGGKFIIFIVIHV